ncbi:MULTISPECIES: flagellar hook assembly protein FlgD [Photorhabdus]|uniref:Basal-body rod modification protein FlgD n=2 Tax=Photorhabdus asymbiotica TaxID=291112 RepID=B6VNB9_PHOAA|nr:flagellar hook assembly protein FlgD [Photorhabdus asymbiotica]RKS56901.1 flagellar basal-body rod modification protein FlgD [Photorhabdus asymbiotica]CAQ84741.1 basal-body rod modification protein flgd (flagellar protein for th initiation of hook assembly) [Photorhabdus asymbiotica]CAR67649.1 basal-body rod modification protein flgd (flagellar protein for th initiation of hook assembly) [Photorhabdus asymbiotica subsp. asymbiotica ATCC 43949]
MAITSSINGSQDNTTVRELAQNSKTNKKNSEELNSNFMQLLIAQVKNQDPTNPMQNNELTAHLAQINMLEGIEKLNTTVGSIVGQINNNQSLQVSALIGRGVMIPGDTILVGTNEKDGSISTTPFGIELERPADSVKVTITDKQGAVVRQIDIGALEAGVHSFPWDGTKEDGAIAEGGAYTITIAASYKGEQRVFQPLRFARVNGVTRDADGAKLDLGRIGTVTMDQVRQIL